MSLLQLNVLTAQTKNSLRLIFDGWTKNLRNMRISLVDTNDALCLLSSIEDVLFRMNVKLSNCRGQCYDWASNMAGCRGGVSTKTLEKESRAIYTHCYTHTLNLAVSDTLKKSKFCRDALV